jgi:hypothetical protein
VSVGDLEELDRLRRHARRHAKQIAFKAIANYVESLVSYAYGYASRLANHHGIFLDVETRFELDELEGKVEVTVKYPPRHLVALENKIYEELVRSGNIPRLTWRQWLIIASEYLRKMEAGEVVEGAGGGEDTTTRQGGAEAEGT